MAFDECTSSFRDILVNTVKKTLFNEWLNKKVKLFILECANAISIGNNDLKSAYFLPQFFQL
jgi:hypothetical protein